MTKDNKLEKIVDDLMKDFDAMMTTPEVTPELKKHVAELTIVPRSEHGPLIWNNQDGNYEDTPDPDQALSDRRVDQINMECLKIRNKTKRGDMYFYKEVNGYYLHYFDSNNMTDEDRRAFLDKKFCHNYDVAYSLHRKHLFKMQKAAQMKVKNLRRDLAAYLTLPQNDVIHEDETAELDNVYNWMLYQTQFDSMKWWQISKAYRRRAMILELVVRYFLETWQTATVLTQEQLQKWFIEEHKGWQVLLEKQIIFIVLSDQTPLVFWDLLFEHVQSLVGTRSVIFVSDKDAKTVLPKELADEYRRCARPIVRQYSKLDKTTYKFQHKSPRLKVD